MLSMTARAEVPTIIAGDLRSWGSTRSPGTSFWRGRRAAAHDPYELPESIGPDPYPRSGLKFPRADPIVQDSAVSVGGIVRLLVDYDSKCLDRLRDTGDRRAGGVTWRVSGSWPWWWASCLSLAPAAPSAARTTRARKPTAASGRGKVAARTPVTPRQASLSVTNKRKSSYSAAAARARRVRLARARAAARARELTVLAQPRFKTDARGRRRARHSRRGGDHLQPGDGAGAVGGTGLRPAIDRQHHEGDDGGLRCSRTTPILSEEVTVDRVDTHGASVTHLRANERVSRRTTCCTCCSSRPTTRRRGRWRARRRAARRGSSPG